MSKGIIFGLSFIFVGISFLIMSLGFIKNKYIGYAGCLLFILSIMFFLIGCRDVIFT